MKRYLKIIGIILFIWQSGFFITIGGNTSPNIPLALAYSGVLTALLIITYAATRPTSKPKISVLSNRRRSGKVKTGIIRE